VSSSALERARKQHGEVVTSFEAAVRERSDRALRTSVLAKFMLVGMAIVAPILTIVVSIAVGLILHSYEGPADASIEYVVWKTGDGPCLGRIVTSDKSGTTLYFGTTHRGVEMDHRLPGSVKLERLKPADVVGRRVFAEGGAGKVERVYTTLVDEKNNRLDIDIYGETVELGEVAGVCLVEGEPPKQVARLEDIGADQLVALDDRLYFVAHDEVRSVPKAGGKVKVVYKSDGLPRGLASDGKYFYFEEVVDIVRVSLTGSDRKKLGTPDKDGLLDETRELTVGEQHLFLSTAKAVQRLPKAGGEVTLLANLEDGRGLIVDEGDLYFHSAAQGKLYRVKKGEDEAEAVVEGLKLTPELNLAVDAERVYLVTADAELYSWSKSGGAPSQVFELHKRVAAFVVHQQQVHHWVDGEFLGLGGGLFSRKLDSKEASANRIYGIDEVCGVAVDGTHLFWVDSSNRRVMSLER
jgi:hypothetical protein